MAREYHALPPGQRASTAILAGNYGEAGAIDRYGPGDGLPPAFSGANNFWFWGPPPARDRSAIAVNIDPALLRRLFTSVRQVAVFRNGLGVSDDEQGAVDLPGDRAAHQLGGCVAAAARLLLTRRRLRWRLIRARS